MALHVAVPMRYIHERHFGRPACPKCGELEHVSEGARETGAIQPVEDRSG
jgi:hypothetical protein